MNFNSPDRELNNLAKREERCILFFISDDRIDGISILDMFEI